MNSNGKCPKFPKLPAENNTVQKIVWFVIIVLRLMIACQCVVCSSFDVIEEET